LAKKIKMFFESLQRISENKTLPKNLSNKRFFAKNTIFKSSKVLNICVNFQISQKISDFVKNFQVSSKNFRFHQNFQISHEFP